MRFKRIYMRICFLTGLLFFWLPVILAQNDKQPEEFSSHWQVGVHGGPTVFFGDVKQNKFWPVSSHYNEWRWAGGLDIGYRISPVFSIALQGVYGNLAGTKRRWNAYFESDYYESNLLTTIDLNNLFGRNRTTRFFSVYVVLGVGAIQFNTELKDLETSEVYRKVGYGDGFGFKGRMLEGIISYGAGFNFRMADRWAAQLQMVFRVSGTDAIDGYIDNFPYDVYNYTSLGVVYKFGFRKKNQVKEEMIPEVTLPPLPVAVPDDSTFMREIEEMKKPVPVEFPPDRNEEFIAHILNYRVQILARFTTSAKVSAISKTYGIPETEIKENIYRGHFIYTVGRFDTYNEARIKRDEMRYSNGIKDAFVVAFKGEDRLDKLPAVK